MIDAPQEALCLCFAEVTMLMSVRYRCLKLSVLWLHILFSPVMRVERALCGVGEAPAESSLMMVYVNRNMLEQLL